MEQLGRVLLVLGLVIAAVGLVLAAGGRIPFLGRLPGDFTFTRDNVTVVFPLATSIVVSLLLTLVLSLVLRR
ncbi:MAG: DUF2905 domain-containing protein [Chloroflexi bacterium]|nr:DUF2905 domain-containing protein [Chloroflexota bacterium]